MRRIDSRTVSLTLAERRALTEFNDHLDDGASIDDAVDLVRTAHPRLSGHFYHYLLNDA
jgi:hypothetical protein